MAFVPDELDNLLWADTGPFADIGDVGKGLHKGWPLKDHECVSGQQLADAVAPVKRDVGLESMINGTAEGSIGRGVVRSEDEMESWLNPLDDLEKNYCQEYFGSLPQSNVQLLKDTTVSGATARMLQQRSHAMMLDHSNHSPLSSRQVSAAAALALGASRAAGIIPPLQNGANAFGKIRTTASPLVPGLRPGASALSGSSNQLASQENAGSVCSQQSSGTVTNPRNHGNFLNFLRAASLGDKSRAQHSGVQSCGIGTNTRLRGSGGQMDGLGSHSKGQDFATMTSTTTTTSGSCMSEVGPSGRRGLFHGVNLGGHCVAGSGAAGVLANGISTPGNGDAPSLGLRNGTGLVNGVVAERLGGVGGSNGGGEVGRSSNQTRTSHGMMSQTLSPRSQAGSPAQTMDNASPSRSTAPIQQTSACRRIQGLAPLGSVAATASTCVTNTGVTDSVRSSAVSLYPPLLGGDWNGGANRPAVDSAEATVTSSSGASGNSCERASSTQKEAVVPALMRKRAREEDGHAPGSEEGEDDSGGGPAGTAGAGGDAKKPGGGARDKTTTATKRSRAAEVHNLSERRRRDRINEKMRTLQELIPNSNKTDKASMLDEAIEYLRMLQLQLQVMSMRLGMVVPPAMLPAGIQLHHGAMSNGAAAMTATAGGMPLGMLDMSLSIPVSAVSSGTVGLMDSHDHQSTHMVAAAASMMDPLRMYLNPPLHPAHQQQIGAEVYNAFFLQHQAHNLGGGPPQ